MDPAVRVSYAVGVDGIALVLIGWRRCSSRCASWRRWHDCRGGGRAAHFFALILVLETFMIGVFAATDVFLFYVFFEAMLIPVYFLIGQFGGAAALRTPR